MAFIHLTDKEAKLYVEQMMTDGMELNEALEEAKTIDDAIDEDVDSSGEYL